MFKPLLMVRSYHVILWLTVGILFTSIFGITSIPNNSNAFYLDEIFPDSQVSIELINVFNKQIIDAIATCMIFLALFFIVAVAYIKDNQSQNIPKSSELSDHDDSLSHNRSLYINACNDAKLKVSALLSGVMSRSREDFNTDQESKIGISNILYNKIDFVEPSNIVQVDVKNVIDNVISILQFKLISKSINFSFEGNQSYKAKTDPLLLEFYLLCIIQRIVEGLTIGKKIHFKFEQNEQGNLQIIIEDNGYEVDFFDFKLNTLMELDFTSIKLLGYKLDCLLSSESYSDKNIKKIIIPSELEIKEQSNVIDFNAYRNKK